MTTEIRTIALDDEELPELKELPEMQLDQVSGGGLGEQLGKIVAAVRDMLAPQNTFVGTLKPSGVPANGPGNTVNTGTPKPPPPAKK